MTQDEFNRAFKEPIPIPPNLRQWAITVANLPERVVAQTPQDELLNLVHYGANRKKGE